MRTHRSVSLDGYQVFIDIIHDNVNDREYVAEEIEEVSVTCPFQVSVTKKKTCQTLWNCGEEMSLSDPCSVLKRICSCLIDQYSVSFQIEWIKKVRTFRFHENVFLMYTLLGHSKRANFLKDLQHGSHFKGFCLNKCCIRKSSSIDLDMRMCSW